MTTNQKIAVGALVAVAAGVAYYAWQKKKVQQVAAVQPNNTATPNSSGGGTVKGAATDVFGVFYDLVF